MAIRLTSAWSNGEILCVFTARLVRPPPPRLSRTTTCSPLRLVDCVNSPSCTTPVVGISNGAASLGVAATAHVRIQGAKKESARLASQDSYHNARFAYARALPSRGSGTGTGANARQEQEKVGPRLCRYGSVSFKLLLHAQNLLAEYQVSMRPAPVLGWSCQEGRSCSFPRRGPQNWSRRRFGRLSTRYELYSVWSCPMGHHL